MGSTHIFQRYSQPENWLTNSTLLLFQYFYNHDSRRFEEFLDGLIGIQGNVSISIGPEFEQQIKAKSSVPDGHIHQKGFSIIIEAKPHGNLNEGQLLSHVDAFKHKGEKILLAITKDPVSEELSKSIKKKIKSKSSETSGNIQFGTTTYEEIILALKDVVKDHEMSLQEILEDYESLCQERDVISSEKYTMLVVPTGDSYDENRKHNIYYDPIDRTHTRSFRYLALYKNKAISCIGEVKYIVGCDLVGEQLVPDENYKDIFKRMSEEDKKSIKNIIRDTDYYDLAEDKKFFVVDKFYDTNYKKTSFGGVRTKKYMLLKDIDDFEFEMSSKELANLLDGQEWS